MAIKIKDVFSAQEIEQLTRRSNAAGVFALLRTWVPSALLFAALIHWPHPLMWLLVVTLLGGQQLSCAIMAHEAAHHSLFRQRWLNQHVVDWLCARPVWLDVKRYRAHHVKHHAHTGTAQDPDLTLVDMYPASPLSMRRRMLRDVLGVTGLKRMLGLFLMDIGAMQYTVAGDVSWRPAAERGLTVYLLNGVRNSGPMLVSNLALLAVLWWAGAAWAYLAWVLAYVTSFSLFLRIRSIAEHACMPGGADMFDNTRTTRAGWLARLCVAPLNVNYHREHHLMASVPYYRLPRMHRMLRERGYTDAPPSYWDVLKTASTARAPDPA